MDIARHLRRLASLLLVGLLTACTIADFSRLPGSQSERRAESLAASGRHGEAAGVYIGLASSAAGAARDRYTLLAVEQWLDAGDTRRARAAQQSVPRPPAGELSWLWTGNEAGLALREGRADEALDLLEPLGRQALPLRDRARVEALRADAWFQKGEPTRAVELFIQRETWLDDRRAVENNRRRLWEGLLVSNPQTLRAAAGTAIDTVVEGWLTLGALAASTGQQGVGWSNGVVRWRETHADHPAAFLVDELAMPDAGLLAYPRRVALLLPLSGANAAAGEAIQNGFFGAYFQAAAALEDVQRVQIYDVAAAGGVTAAYSRALEDGAEFVVGPLQRSDVIELAEVGMLPVPVLALNNLPDNAQAPPGLYQFALAPEDEAATAASRAIADGLDRAVMLYPANEWGRRVAGSFAGQFEAQGGTVLDHRSYLPNDQDFSADIESLMALSASIQRFRRLRANLAEPMQFDPRRRQDVDMVFLAADAKAGRLIKSQLKFHYSGDLPVYSTSFIYSMDGRSDADLNGVIFADTYWIVDPPPWIADYPRQFAEFWPGERRLGRLHAIGYDAYHLVAPLFSAGGRGMEEFVGATGRLFLSQDGRIHRRLPLARFERGEPVALPDEGRDDGDGGDALPGEEEYSAPPDPVDGWTEPPGSP